jgi:hypothetical protein
VPAGSLSMKPCAVTAAAAPGQSGSAGAESSPGPGLKDLRGSADSQRVNPRRLPLVMVLGALLALVATAPAMARPAHHPRLGERSIAVRAIASGGYHGLPLARARVSVRSGSRVVARGRTGFEGVALVHSRRPVAGADLRVVVSGGRVAGRRFGGHMVTGFGDYSWPQTVYVDSVTTLAARFSAAHRDMPQRRALRRVRAFLGLPSFYEIGLDARTDVAFDGRRFLRAARPGGYDALVGRLVQRMTSPGARRSFRHSGHRSGATASGLEGGAGGLQAVTEAIAAGTGFFNVLQKTDAVLTFADAIIDLAHAGEGPSQAEIQAIDAQLEQVEQSLVEVREAIGQVEEQAAKRSYSSLLREIKPSSEGVKEAESILNSAIKAAAQYGCGTNQPEATHCAEVEGMLHGPGGLVQQISEGDLSGPVGLNTYGGRIAGEAGPRGIAEEEGVVQAGSEMITDRTGGVYFDAEASQRVRAIAAYWAASFAEAYALAPIAWGLAGDNTLTLEHAVTQVQPTAEAMQTLIPQSVPPSIVLDMPRGLMWPTQLAAGPTHPYDWYVSNADWHYSASSGEWNSLAGGTAPAIAATGAEPLPYENWRVAGPADVEVLVGSAKGGEALQEATGISQEVLTPVYAGDERGVETQWQTVQYTPNSGCKTVESSRCFWPTWIAEGFVTNLNGGGNATYSTSPYEENELPGEFAPVFWWGLRGSTLYGSDPVAKIPILLSREVQPANCYYYPAAGAPAVGSPGCPGQGS